MSDRAIIFYDGECALCHGLVKFVLKRDREGIFQFAPLQGETIKKIFPDEVRAKFPDSIVLYAPPADAKVKSEAVAAIFRGLPGYIKEVGDLIAVLPRGFSDFFYDLVAKVRKKIFGTTVQMCPLVPDDLRSRILP